MDFYRASYRILLICHLLRHVFSQPRDTLVFDDTFIGPIYWNPTFFTLVLDHKYVNFTLEKFDLSLTELHASKFYYQKFSKKLMVISPISDSKIFRILDMKSNSFTFQWNFLSNYEIIGEQESNGLWTFESNFTSSSNAKVKVFSYFLFESSLKIVAELAISLAPSAQWTLLTVFQWSHYTYTIAIRNLKFKDDNSLFNKSLITLVRLSSKAIINSSFKKLLFKNLSDQNFRDHILRSSETQRSINMRDVFRSLSFEVKTELMQLNLSQAYFAPDFGDLPAVYIKSDYEVLIFSLNDLNRVLDTDITVSSPARSCHDFESAMLQKDVPCDSKSLAHFRFGTSDTVIGLKLVLSSPIYPGIFFSKPINKYLSFQRAENGVLRCIFSFPIVCTPLGVKMDFTYLLGTYFDVLNGSVTFSMLKNRSYVLQQFSIFDCSEFHSCSDCEMLGFYFCTWEKVNRQCKKIERRGESEANKCYKITRIRTLEQSKNQSILLNIQTDHHFDPIFEKAYLKVAPSYQTWAEHTGSAFRAVIDAKVFAKKTSLHIELYIKRSTGGPMMANFEYAIGLRFLTFFWFMVGTLFFVLLLALSVAYSFRAFTMAQNKTKGLDQFSSIKSESRSKRNRYPSLTLSALYQKRYSDPFRNPHSKSTINTPFGVTSDPKLAPTSKKSEILITK